MDESTCYHFFPISEFSYKLIRFLLDNSLVKSDNEKGKIKFAIEIWNGQGGLGLSRLIVSSLVSLINLTNKMMNNNYAY